MRWVGTVDRAGRAEDFPHEDSKYQGGEVPPWLQQTLLGLWQARGREDRGKMVMPGHGEL